MTRQIRQIAHTDFIKIMDDKKLLLCLSRRQMTLFIDTNIEHDYRNIKLQFLFII